MNEFFAELRKRLIGQKFVLAVASMVFATVIALLQRWFGFPTVVFFIMPVITGALIWNQSKSVAGVAIFLAFLSVAILGFPEHFRRDPLSSLEQFLVSASGLIYIAFVLRFSTVSDSQLGGLLTSRINYTPAQTFDESQKPMQGNNLSAGLLLASWFVGWFLCGDLKRIQENQNKAYDRMVEQLRASIGLETPEIYLAMKLLITLMLLLWIVNQLFSYWQLRSDSGSVAEMHLRSELWKWNGSEQRRVSKQGRKNIRVLTTSKNRS